MMKRNLLKFLLLITIIFLPTWAKSVFACQCYGLPTPYQAFKESNVVFTGKVEEILDSEGNKVEDEEKRRENGEIFEGYRFYRFAVDESFKGDKKQEVVIGLSLNMCQFGFKKGDNLLVYASEDEGKLWTGTFCYRTKDINETQDDIHFLREILQNKSEPRIYGSVRLDNVGFNPPQLKFVEGIKIVAQSLKGKRKYIAFTDKNGLYRFNKLPNGTYIVSPELPKKYTLSFWLYKEKIKLVSEEIYEHLGYEEFWGKSAYADFRIAWNNKVTGKVLDAESKPLEHATVRLIPIDKIEQISEKPLEDDEYYKQSLYPINPQSKIRGYKISNTAPGKYILAVEIYAPFSDGKDRFRMYYPQTTDPKQSKVITIGEFGEQSIDIKLPAEFILREIEGSFIWQDGTPVNGGWIFLKKNNSPKLDDNYLYDKEKTEVTGKFKFKVFENTEYWIHSEVDLFKAKPIKVKVGKSNELIKISISTTDNNQ
ncbi:MAG: hypothetical protein K1X72_11440 [Pyrinomonadaceae bacterium]|nr:hypothetical protein [Pyrinomonadaceae bacterium]